MRISRDVIGGEFEVALEGMLLLLQSCDASCALPPALPPARPPALPQLTRSIAGVLRASFTGLHPNGLDFGIWLWETAPLHVASVVQPAGGTADARHVLYPLRGIAAGILGLYVGDQPRVCETVLPLLDASVGEIDARLLIDRGLSPSFGRRFPAEQEILLPWLRDDAPWRRMIPPEALRDVIAARPEETAAALSLLRPQFGAAQAAPLAQSHRRVFRTALLQGDRDALLSFLATLRPDSDAAAMDMACSAAVSCRASWTDAQRAGLQAALRAWDAETPAVRAAIAAFR